MIFEGGIKSTLKKMLKWPPPMYERADIAGGVIQTQTRRQPSHYRSETSFASRNGRLGEPGMSRDAQQPLSQARPFSYRRLAAATCLGRS